MAACVLGLAPTLVSMWPLRCATACSAATEASTTAAHASRRGVGAVSSALSGLRGRHSLSSAQFMDGLRSNLQVERNLTLSPKSPMSRSDDSAITCKGFCTILWNLKADLQDGCLIFITGDPLTLGCWESNMAVQLAPSVESNNIWTAEIKVPYGVHFKYSYFVREEMSSSSDIIWRPGPVYSLSIPSDGQKKQVIIVKDLWMKTSLPGLPTPTWGSWLMEADSLEGELFDGGNNQNIVKDHSVRDTRNQGLSVGDHIILKLGNGTPLHAKLLSDNQSTIMHNCVTEIPNASYISQYGRPQVVEEPWILESIVSAKKPVAKVKDKKGQKKLVNYKHTLSGVSKNMHEQYQPVEEPWLFQSILELNETIVLADGKVEARDIIRKLRKIEKPLTPLDESKPTGGEPSSRVILMNSSVCTMQRIAVLEDGKLVELLLEPIKNNVQCDSIYLGVVTKLVPHMGGAFVDIGISRPSLMSIKQNRDPFVYPQVFKNRGTDHVGDYCNEENLPAYENDDDMSDDEFADEEAHDGSSFPVENVTDNNVDDDEVDSISVYDVDKDEENDHMEDEYSEGILQGYQSEISNDLKTLSSIQHALRESNDDTNGSRWSQVRKGTKVMVQVVKEGLGTKGPTLSPFPCLRSRFWILVSRGNKVGVSKKITGIERTRLKGITKLLRPPGFTLTARTVAAGHSWEELQKDLDGLLSTWKGITEHAQSAALAADEGVEGAVPVMLHRAKGQTLSVVQDDFNEKVKRLVVDSPRTYHEVTSYLEEVAPELYSRVELYEKRKPIFDEYNIEKEIDNILCKRVPLNNGGSLVIEQTEALVSVDVNGGHSMFGQGTSQEKAILEVNLEAAKQIARELRLRDIGGIIIVDFIDMSDDSNKKLVYEEMKKAVEKDRSTVGVSELSKLGLMEITRKRVRPSVTFMISEPCTCCHGTGRVEALDTSFSKIEREICRRLAASRRKSDPEKPKSWPRFLLRVDHEMCTYLTSGKKTKLGLLSSSLKVWILLKIARGFSRGAFELLPYSEKENYSMEKETSELPQKESRPKLSVFPIKKWMSRAKRAK
ncbi:ribonuclease E/G-like protein, chloroplastic [Zea mays]|uniref:CBM20 domain-containing protein n=2 Tax=Zea mays TaxID=4577 RepID=A0A804LV37_MAIZE|nr:ribonuclease E/G-like protein, chloroplastic [Zea mays]|eukprot:XP_020402250.1 ribonuclease E/G-like protein, chloroplastic [Zea mays]